MPTPDIRAVVVDPNPINARGIASVLSDAGIKVDRTEDVRGWADSPGRRVAVVAVSAASGSELIRHLRSARSDMAIIAVIDTGIPTAYAEALNAGACSAFFREAPAQELAAVVDAALHGFSLLPIGVAHHLVDLPRDGSSACVTPRDVATLRALAQGDAVAALARTFGCSEREMHRKLRKLYDRMGAANRSGAIVLATRLGLVAAQDDRIVVDLGYQAEAERGFEIPPS